MSLSAISDPNQFVPVFASENAQTAREAAQAERGKLSLFAEGDEEPSFWDLVDVINPLQHIPVVNTLYQELTGDRIGIGARLTGGALFGGPIGLVASAAGIAVEAATGDDVGGHVLALFRDEDPAAGDTQLAEAVPAPAPAPALAASPAPAEIAQAGQAPVLTLPEPAAPPAGGGTPMMFSVDGPLPEAQPQAAAPMPAPMPVAVAGEPLRLAANGQPARFMPLPSRSTAPQAAPPPPVSVPISNSGSRSNVPITGRNNSAINGPSALAVQKIMAEQGLTKVEHPMLPSVAQPASPATAPAAAPSPAGGQADWLSNMAKALDQYERNGNLAAGRQSPVNLQ